jgi:predicted DNA-binding protein
MVHMAESLKPTRQSVTLPQPIARRIRALAKRENRSSNRIIVDLIEAGLDAREREKKTFFELADRLATSTDPSEQNRLKRELARLTYGE